METKKMGEFYQFIAEKLNDIIPCEWRKIVLYAEVMEDATEVYFYFDTPQNGGYKYSHSIPKIYGVSEKTYMDLLFELHEHFEALQKEYREHNDEVWSHLTLVLESTGKFKIEYHYGNVYKMGLDLEQRKFVWKYKNLGVLPEEEEDRKFLEEYLKSKGEIQN